MTCLNEDTLSNDLLVKHNCFGIGLPWKIRMKLYAAVKE